MNNVVFTEAAPAPIGPYSQGIIANGPLVFLSGQIPLDASGAVVGVDVAAQTHQVFANIRNVLAAAGASFDDVVKTTVYLKNMADFPAVNGVYAEYFTSTKPARSTVEVARLPKDVLVEIEVIARYRG